ncbi:hypothetical protein AOLI_G00070600 [Acnodon oligacanthus]
MSGQCCSKHSIPQGVRPRSLISDPIPQKQWSTVPLCPLPVPREGGRRPPGYQAWSAATALEERGVRKIRAQGPVFIQVALEWPAQRRRWGQRVSAYLPPQPRSLSGQSGDKPE